VTSWLVIARLAQRSSFGSGNSDSKRAPTKQGPGHIDYCVVAYITISLRSFEARNAIFLLALILMVSPVPGLRPMRAGRFLTCRMPRPEIRIRAPFFRCFPREGDQGVVVEQLASEANKELPPKASLLYGIETPSAGGETFFYNLYKAYATLPQTLKSRIQALSCKHDATRNSSGQLRKGFEERYSNAERPGAIHPLVVRHPETGRPSLYLGRRPNAWIVGLSDADSDALLDELWAHVQQGPHLWTQEWRQGDLVIWDNRCTLHRRNQLDPSLRRLMHRTQVRDKTRPVAANTQA